MNNDIKGIIEILELCKDDFKSNNENVTVILDYEDLKALQNLYDLYKKQEAQINHLIQKTINYDKTIEKTTKIIRGELVMEEDIEVLKSIVKVNKDFLMGVENQTINQREIQALENLLNKNKELEEEIKELNSIQKFAKEMIKETCIAENEQLKKEIEKLKKLLER